MTIAVVFAVGLVVALVVADQVPQGKTVVGNHVVDRFGRAAAAGLVQVSGAAQADGEIAPGTAASAGIADSGPLHPKTAHGITELVIPLQPFGCKAPALVATRANVPGFGNHLDA
ncbi:hypothetical protein GALL_528020 [mine drainage metagenome]|uniref:Uncharacterized protein n=1 Tax=mine drainage metagenome TaxID=410659 RepID=A0A1J5PPZ4_9ZZZZ